LYGICGSCGGEYDYQLLDVMLCSLVDIYQISGRNCCHHPQTVSSEMFCSFLSDFMAWYLLNLLGALKISRISSAVRKSIEKFTPDSTFYASMSIHYLRRVCLLASLPLCILQKLIRNISCCPLFSLFPLQILL
jgi:hypothetical protein